MAYIYSLADTWNASGTTFTGIGLNVTDTASAAGSLLMDLQVGGVSKFRVRKNGTVLFNTDSSLIPTGNSLEYWAVNSIYKYWAVNYNDQSMDIYRGFKLRIESPVVDGTFAVLAADAANTLAQRNGVNAQAFNLYNTYTDASNYERGFMRWASNILTIGADKLGTGSARPIVIDGGAYINLNVAGVNKFGIGGNGNVSYQPLAMSNNHIEFTEQTAPAAPATNVVRIYAEDDGAGKTRLMARFATGAAVQIVIEP